MINKTRVRYDYNYLKQFCDNNKIILEKNYLCEQVNRNTLIIGKCINTNCKNSFNICFREFVKYLNFGCNECRKKITSERRKQKCINTYGVDHFMKVKEIKKKADETFNKNYGNNYELISEKRKKTFLEKYGVEHPFQNKTIKQKFKNTIKEKYGVEFILQNDKFKNKFKETCLEKYGVEHPMQLEENIEKAKKTCLEKYGVEHPMNSDVVKNKFKETCLEKYGVEHPMKLEENIEKAKKTCLEKYGVKHPMQLEENIEKAKKTCLEKYGVEHPTQSEDIMEKASKNAYNLKEYKFISGKIIKVQGYECFALDNLIYNEKIIENDIFTGSKNVPKIWYNDKDNKKRRHYVDIYIPSQNRCIEVKSTWTAEKKKDNIFLKQIASKELGYNYEIWIYDEKATRVETIL
jgi:hypothetical protein